jgi:hypothetical protein
MQPPCNTKYFSTQSKPNLEEVAKARPPRGNGAPSRCKSHKERILALLKQRGAAGILSSELYDNPSLYGRSPRNRISELRSPEGGCLIETITVDASTVRYVLLRDSNGEQPKQNSSNVESTLPAVFSNRVATNRDGRPLPVAPGRSTTTETPSLFDMGRQ